MWSCAPNGDVYFTDPIYGLVGHEKDPAREIPWSGVYRARADGGVDVLDKTLTFPNGLAFSPDGKTLYVAESDPARAIWMAYDVDADGGVANGRVFFDATSFVKAGKKGLPDGLKVDVDGNLFATGPGGVFVFSPAGKHLGTIVTGEPTANCAFGDDGQTLYMTANDKLMRIRLRPAGSSASRHGVAAGHRLRLRAAAVPLAAAGGLAELPPAARRGGDAGPRPARRRDQRVHELHARVLRRRAGARGHPRVSVVTFGYGPEGKHGANYMQTHGRVGGVDGRHGRADPGDGLAGDAAAARPGS